MSKVFRYWVITLVLLAISLPSEGQGGIRLGNTQMPERSSNGDLELARQYYEKGEYEKALVYLEKLQKTLRSKVVYDLSLNSYLALEDFKKAENFVEDYLKRSPGNHASYYADLLYVYLEQSKTNKADKLVEDVMAEVQQSPGMAYSFANAFQERGYPKIALEIYELGEKLMPNANFQYQKALLYGELGDIKRMYTAYVDMVESSPGYLNTVKQLLARAMQEDASSENIDYLKEQVIQRIQKGAPQTLNDLLVFVYIQEKNFRGAFTQLKALDKRKPTNKGELYNLGNVVLNNEDYLLARHIFQYIIDAGQSSAYYERAVVAGLKAEKERLLNNADTDRKLWLDLQSDHYKALNKLKGQPELADVMIELADLSAFQLNEADTAIGMLKSLLKSGYIGPEDQAKAKIKLADILLYDGNRWDAIIYYSQAEKAFEQSPIGQEAKFKRAKAAYYVGDFQWAQGIFGALKTSTSKLIANDAMMYSLLITDNVAMDSNYRAMEMFARADLMNYQNKPDSALRILELMDVAFVGHPIQDEALFLKSRIFIKLKRYREAADNLENLIEDHGEDILADDALYTLAQLYEQHLNKQTAASDLYRQLFTDHPDSFFASDARKRYRELRGDVIN